jgi:REP element-mobilizing transposase RayT
MPVKQTIPYTDGIFYITFTCANWLPLIEKVNGYELVYHWLDHLKANGHFIIGYVIMPNHVHVIIAFRNKSESINTITGNGKRFMAYSIVQRLKEQNEIEPLGLLESNVEQSRKAKNKQHHVWELSFDWKCCNSNEFILQKLHYFHNNPCQGKWNLCNSPIDYKHSPAKYYLTGEQGVYPVTSYAYVVGEVDLTAGDRAP